MGLAITRNLGESVWIGDNIRITVASTGGRIRLHIEADDSLPIMREELRLAEGKLPLINGRPVIKHSHTGDYRRG